MDQCIKCSICNAFCPVLRATGRFPGPKLTGPDAERFRLPTLAISSKWLEYCDYCKICERVCPHNVDIPELHLRSRMAWMKTRKPLPRDWLLGHAYLLEKLGSLSYPISNWIVGGSFFRWLLDRGLKIDYRAKIPFTQRPTFRKWFSLRPPAKGKPIAYFHGCYTNYIDPDVGRAVVDVLEKSGYAVILPRQECCGLPLISNGLFQQAAKMGARNIKSLGENIAQGVEVVYSSPSCGLTLTHEYKSILQLPGSSVLVNGLSEISQFLFSLHEAGKMNVNFKETNETLYYHAPCHIRALHIGLPAMELLALIPGLRVIELPEGCCGLAGSYGLKKEKYILAKEVGTEIFQAILKAEAKAVISDCEACRLQIEHHTGIQTLHPMQILSRAYG
jgi:glycerol-3-phosphate dehydrogenase subunit C